MKKRPRILALPTQLQIFIEISRIELPGNQVKIFISLDSASFTESETLFRLQKISTGKKWLLGIQPRYKFIQIEMSLQIPIAITLYLTI